MSDRAVSVCVRCRYVAAAAAADWSAHARMFMARGRCCWVVVAIAATQTAADTGAVAVAVVVVVVVVVEMVDNKCRLASHLNSSTLRVERVRQAHIATASQSG